MDGQDKKTDGADKPEKPAGPPQKGEKQARPPKPGKPDKGDGAAKGQKPEKGQKSEKGQKPEKGEKPGKAEKEVREKLPPARLKVKFRDEVVPQLMSERGYKNKLAVPRMVKICLNMGVGKAREDAKAMEQATGDMALISGQKAVITLARQSISNFRLRKGYNVGCKVTLRGARMYEFFDRLVNIAMPRIRDFRGLNPKSFDKRGNYNLGLSEQTVFPEIDPDKVQFTQGMHITIVTTARNPEEGQALLRKLGMPFAVR
jgi:large subunit ribosomal protein L5